MNITPEQLQEYLDKQLKEFKDRLNFEASYAKTIKDFSLSTSCTVTAFTHQHKTLLDLSPADSFVHSLIADSVTNYQELRVKQIAIFEQIEEIINEWVPDLEN
jgi:hypothetical protein